MGTKTWTCATIPKLILRWLQCLLTLKASTWMLEIMRQPTTQSAKPLKVDQCKKPQTTRRVTSWRTADSHLYQNQLSHQTDLTRSLISLDAAKMRWDTQGPICRPAQFKWHFTRSYTSPGTIRGSVTSRTMMINMWWMIHRPNTKRWSQWMSE